VSSLKRSTEDRVDHNESIREAEEDFMQEVLERKRKKLTEKNLLQNTKEISAKTKDFMDQEVEDMKFKSVKEMLKSSSDGGATRYLEVDGEYETDAFSLAKRNIEISRLAKEGKIDMKYYRGENGYVDYLEKTEEDLKMKQASGTFGPIRAPTHIRATCRFDYHPEMCKDYKETGYCGYGDSCKFIHDRGDYKPGWLIDQEYEREIKEKELRQMGYDVGKKEENYEIVNSDEEYEDVDGVPVKCRICQDVMNSPVVTKCEHYFCEKCAIEKYRKDKKCFVCKKPTLGIFNEAEKIKKKIKSMTPVELSKFKKKAESDEASEGLTKSETDTEKGYVTEKQQFMPEEHKQGDKQNGKAGSNDKDDEQKLFKEYVEHKKQQKVKTYAPIGGWIIP